MNAVSSADNEPASNARRSGARRRELYALLLGHRELVLVLVLATALRVGATFAYRPALFFSDSWGYLKMALAPGIVGIAPLRPSGYPLLLRAFSLNGHSLVLLVTVQHLAGIATGVLVYLALLRAGTQRWLAGVGCAIVLLDMWSVALEQRVLSEALFTAALMGSLFLTAGSTRARSLIAGGLLFALAVTMRPVALFAAPVWILYLILRGSGPRALAAGIGALLVPLLLYCSLHAGVTGTFGFTQTDGWFLYARVGQIVDCRGLDVSRATAGLCVKAPASASPNYFLFDRRSPAKKVFGGLSADHVRQAHSDDLLRSFALRMIEARPGPYMGLVATDLLRFFTPGASDGPVEDATVMAPRRVRLSAEDIRQRVGLPAYSPSAHPPAQLLSWLAGWLHTARWLMALLAASGLLGLILRRRHSRLVLLFTGSALAMLIGSAATAGFAIRYLEPVVPLLVVGGLLAFAAPLRPAPAV